MRFSSGCVDDQADSPTKITLLTGRLTGRHMLGTSPSVGRFVVPGYCGRALNEHDRPMAKRAPSRHDMTDPTFARRDAALNGVGQGVLARQSFALVLVVTIVPVWVAAWQVAAKGTWPSGDAGLTVARARDVFTMHPPLVGMAAASGAFNGSATHFPGPLQLYALAVPVKLFGNVWGPPLAMAALSTLWIVLSAWVLRRSIGARTALAGLALIGVFTWSIGVDYLVDPVPMAMVIFPLVPFLLTAWCAATGDCVALVVAAVIGNFLWLDHLVLVVVVPVVASVAVVGHLAAHRHTVFVRRGAQGRDHLRAMGGLIAATAVSILMWLPTLIAEAKGSPGNLRMLVQSSGHERQVIASWSFALHVVVDLIAYPPFWLRSSFNDAPFNNVPGAPTIAGSPTTFDFVVGTVGLVVLVALLILTYRSGRQNVFWGLAIAAAAIVGAVPTIYLTPTKFGIAGYLYPLWGIAAFVWFMAAFTVFQFWNGNRSSPGSVLVGRSAATAMAAVVIVVAALNLTMHQPRHWPAADEMARVAAMNQALRARAGNLGPIAVRTHPDFATQFFFGALVLTLRTADVDFCVQSGSPPLDGIAECAGKARRVVRIQVTDDVDPQAARSSDSIVVVPFLSQSQERRFAYLDERVRTWLARPDRIGLSVAGRRVVDASGPSASRLVEPLLDPVPQGASPQGRADALRGFVRLWVADPDRRGVTPFEAAPLTLDELRNWSDLSSRRKFLVVAETGDSTS